MNLSKNFTLEEMTASTTAKNLVINNTPSAQEIENLRALCVNVLQPLRDALGEPIIVSSGYRCAKLNNAVGGAKNSHHVTGQAADIHTLSDKPKDNKKLFDLFLSLHLPFTQLIDEYGYNWVHISYQQNNLKNQILHIK